MATTQETSKPNLEFTKINSYIHLYTPPSIPTSAVSKDDPTTIIFCQWMGASPRSRSLHVAYHEYHARYPCARILVIRSVAEWFVSTSTSKRRSLLAPAVSVIESDPAKEKRILVHLFSNGGGVSFMDICIAYKEQIDKVLPVKAMVLDSVPGNPNFSEGWAAMSVGLPKGLLWYPSTVVLGLILVCAFVSKYVIGFESLVDEMREGLNEWDVVDRNMARLYIYSEADRLVGWRVVEKHIQDSREKGVKVLTLKETETPHVQHITKDKVRYWEKVSELWESTKG